ncbi:ALG3-domain-containing protein [Metschnikowia bicuspidata var. bicuspidata NRRL YB-4993]|uniref:Dol-P-Man:Man(5)GlcNAc(2)-PP-Dol alpha-1,3-mannosyltransferase n=1 Tax=Metschnikowia bicuspidata var. bicuspidata NRRL YB-4993 TaxID=869754 RepID=A0A1A0H9B9_9ASCO|nr:ALG3-domain-containing protein [Metschnikowia bicuspidata var. bicuspidata NRRL YB-4993]OBA20482.1 ALG3-domain-containing protein [Metschnikowia bicuspidata var. bicuspidata NRRL YB-4993]
MAQAESSARKEVTASVQPDQQQKTPPELPAFTVKNVALDIVNGAVVLVYEPAVNRAVVPVLVFLSSMICKFIISHVPYTEVDFSTYMQQVELVNAGALDYSQIVGDTGPVVYPAGFIQVYQTLYWLTDGGANLRIAQLAFGYLFSVTVIFTCAVYTMAGDFPPWPLYLLLCSKRLYSIYVLRMFNDCFTTIGVLAVILILQQASYWAPRLSGTVTFWLCAVAADVFSMALSVKMNVLLYLPAFVIVVYFLVGERLFHCLAVVAVIPLVQVLIGWRFLLPLFWDDEARYLRRMYLTRAFDFSRKFLHTWTVNWRFVPEDMFVSDEFARYLLVGHVAVLLLFVATRFVSPRVTQKSLWHLAKDGLFRPFKNTRASGNLFIQQSSGPRLILLTFAVTNLVGILFSRSLHYQFLSWYQWLFPFMLHAAGCNVFTGALIFAAHEWCWNVFPSTVDSSKLLVAILAVVLVATWYNADYYLGGKPKALETKK